MDLDKNDDQSLPLSYNKYDRTFLYGKEQGVAVMTTAITAEPAAAESTHAVFKAQEWFTRGARVPYDPEAKRILDPAGAQAESALHVWRRVERQAASDDDATWTTFMPGFPDGAVGWAPVDHHLAGAGMAPQLFVEYVGQGDSDKPAKYPYGSMERADLVEALWAAEGVRSTFLVTFDYSSLVALELLSRQQERLQRGDDLDVEIEGVLFINGGYFADAHSHPWWTTPALNSPIGGLVTWAGQRLRFMANPLLKSVFATEYHVTSEELDEMYDAIRRRDGFRFLSRGAGFRPEHQAHYAERWDLRRLFLAFEDSVSFHVVGSEGDIFEPNQVVKARERLGDRGLDIRMLPGGPLSTSEQPEALARIIQEVGPVSRPQQAAG